MPSINLTSYALILILSLMACTTPSTSPESEAKPQQTSGLHGQPQPEVWFKGRPEQAFAQAKAENKLVFLYWGAVWCPPCNELKAEVFSKASFADLMKNFIAVYLDGDTEEAQVWGERLSASGYPTVLVLTGEGREIYRLNTSLNEEDFVAALQPVLQKNQNFAEAFGLLEKGNVKADDWKVLAYTSWDQLPETIYSGDRLLNAAKRAADKCPANLLKEKAIFAANLLTLAAAQRGDKESAQSVSDIKAEAKRYLDAIFADKVSIQAARTFLNSAATPTVELLYGKAPAKGYQELKKRWLKACKEIAANSGNSVDTRLESWSPALEFQKFENPQGPMPAQLRAGVQKAVAEADQNAKTVYERHAVISSAAFLLRQVGDFEGARQLLQNEVLHTDTPWYYYSSLAALEQELKNDKAAQGWATKARESAQGRATKVQWITNDILLNASIKNPEQKGYLLNLTKEYYEVATGLQDGFSGRNWSRAKKVQSSLKNWHKDPAFIEVFALYERRCSQLESESQKNCQKHFAELKN